jgi:Pvc16 N-terminal domain
MGQHPSPEGLASSGLPAGHAPARLAAMIHDVDESLRALVKRDALNGSNVEIAFDAPTKDWAARRNTPTLDLYLYDIREDLARRDVTIDRVRDPHTGVVTARQPRPRRFKLSYLATAWTQRPEDEHRLLSALLSCFVRHEFVPTEVLTGELARLTLPCPVTIALPPPQDRSLSDVWSALGGELKPSLDIVVVVPMEVHRLTEAAPPVLDRLLDLSANGGHKETRRRARSGDGESAAAGARGSRRGGGVEGLDAIPEQMAGLARRVGAHDAPEAPGTGPRPPVSPDEPTVQEDVVVSRREPRPGRIVRVRGVRRT